MKRGTLASTFSIALSSCAISPVPNPPTLMDDARVAGARSLHLEGRPDGGEVLGGTMAGRQFAIAIPPRWNRQALLFAHGYTMPGTPTEVSKDPVAKDESKGLLEMAYKEGFAVGQSAYVKSGIAIRDGTESTLRLKRLLEALGTRRVYVSGASMGGAMVMELIERHPGEFAGALSVCGVTDSYLDVVGRTIDIRALYNYVTSGTVYALPGVQDISRSAMPTSPPKGLGWAGGLYRVYLLKHLAAPTIRLFKDAAKNPNGDAARMVVRISSLAGIDPDAGSFLFPLLTAALGMDDIRASAGGNPYSNRTKIYSDPTLSPMENRALNAGVQRIDAEPTAVQYADRWYTSSGRISAPLVVMHNQIDPLVPENQLAALKGKASALGTAKYLTTMVVPSMRSDIPLSGGLKGFSHCGFTAAQLARAWSALRLQVEVDQGELRDRRNH